MVDIALPNPPFYCQSKSTIYFYNIFHRSFLRRQSLENFASEAPRARGLTFAGEPLCDSLSLTSDSLSLTSDSDFGGSTDGLLKEASQVDGSEMELGRVRKRRYSAGADGGNCGLY